MAKSAQDLEGYLLRLGRPFETLDGAYVLSASSYSAPLVIRVAPPVVVLQVNVGPAPTATADQAARVFRRLLELNAADLVHASYGLAQGIIVLTASLELDNLDMNELEAALADIDLAMATHVTEIHKLY